MTTVPVQAARSTAMRLIDEIEKRPKTILFLFTIGFFALALLRSSLKPFWYDEFFTIHVARLPHLADFWAAILSGVEGSPPLIHLLTRAAEAIHPSLTRLPAMLGAYVLAIALFKIVAVRAGVLYGLVAMLVPFVTHANYHVTEARPYAPVLGCSALAFLCWQRISFPSTRRLALFGLWLSLLVASGLHYYAPLAVIPLALGEIARSLQQRKIDVPVWVAFTAPIIPLLLHVPLIKVMMTFTDGFWSRSSPILLMHPYEILFGPAVPFAMSRACFHRGE